MRGILSLRAATVLAGALFVAGWAAANPVGVPVAESPPLSCTTTGGNFFIAKTACSGSTAPPACPTGNCTDYCYTITGLTALNPDHTIFEVSATQDLVSTAPSGAAVFAPGAGDNTTGFLAGAIHEYAIRFDSAGTKNAATRITVSGASAPRLGTVLVRSGTRSFESCLIATPGTTPNPFQPTFSSQEALVAGGKCKAHLVFDATGNLTSVTTDPPCVTNDNPGQDVLFANGTPLRNNTSPFGITFGNGTSTCYGPPSPSRPVCICTSAPCP